MTIIQRVEHLAKYIEKFIISSQRGNFGSVDVILLLPVDIPQVEKWIPVLKGFPQFLEINFRVTEFRQHKSHFAGYLQAMPDRRTQNQRRTDELQQSGHRTSGQQHF